MAVKMTYVHKDPNGECCKRARLDLPLKYWLLTDGTTYYERDNWNPHFSDSWLYEEALARGWNTDYIEIKDATFAVFLQENIVESLLTKEELQKCLPCIKFVN